VLTDFFNPERAKPIKSTINSFSDTILTANVRITVTSTVLDLFRPRCQVVYFKRSTYKGAHFATVSTCLASRPGPVVK
jgi:hypothetical protein